MIPDIESMTTADLAAFHRDVAGLARDLLADLEALHHGEHFRLFWPDLPSPVPDLDAALRFGEATRDLVGGFSALVMQGYLAETELESRKYPN